jgi:hypothetical protein
MMQASSSPSNFRYPWQHDYEAALVELDPEKLSERIHTAEAAIFNRLQELAESSSNADQKAERQAIEDALAGLRVLQRDKLGFHDWKKE